MGAKASTEFGQIYVNTDKPSYFQGEYVYGTISLNLVKDFPGYELYLKIKGKEDAHWSEGSGKDRRHYHGKKIIISHQFLIYKFNSNRIPLGQYNFPFSVYMNPGLPASFKNVGTDAKVSYKLKGEIKSIDKNYKAFRSSKELHLKQAKNDAYAPPITNLQIKVDICCCFAQGSTNIETRVNKTNFFEGEVASIDCFVSNANCNLPLTTVELQLVRRLKLKSDGGHINTIAYTICSRINRLNLPPRSPSQAQTRFEIPIVSNVAGTKLLTTSQGEKVSNCYYLTLFPRYESFLCNCCTKSVETPVLIYEPRDVDIQQVQAPENWNPQVMPSQNFDWKSAQMYQGRNSGGYNYPAMDQNQMFQQFVPPSQPMAPAYNQGYNNQGQDAVIAANTGMNYNQYNYNQPGPAMGDNNFAQDGRQPLNQGNYEFYGYQKENVKP